MQIIIIRKLTITLLLVCAPVVSWAHHSVAGFFDPDEPVEIEGVVTSAVWRNPHTEFEVDVTDENGDVTTWKLESGALGVLRARGLAHEFLKVGDHIRVRGDKSLRGLPEMFARNMLLSNGKEVVLTATAGTYFENLEDAEVYEGRYDEAVANVASEKADGIFRVWSSNLDERPTSGSLMYHGDYPMTDEARAIREKFDPSDNALLECNLWKMPRLVANPLPIEFVRRGENIALRFEEDDQERTIHMNTDNSNAPAGNIRNGYSTGRWEGNTLVVETTNITPNRLDNFGTPFSEQIRVLERYTPSEEYSRLNLALTITDPGMFTDSFEVKRYWIWRPEIILDGYSCNEEDRFAESNSGDSILN